MEVFGKSVKIKSILVELHEAGEDKIHDGASSKDVFRVGIRIVVVIAATESAEKDGDGGDQKSLVEVTEVFLSLDLQIDMKRIIIY